MDLKQIKRLVTIAVFGLISIVIAMIIIRIFLLVIGANKSSQVVTFIYGASDVFVGMFRGIYPDIIVNNGQFVIEIFSLVGLFFYVTVAFLVSKSIRSVLETDIIQLLTNLIDTGFKFAEFVLIMRFVFKLTGASVTSQFVTALYEISAVIYEPFKGILPGFSIPSLNSVFETSTIIAIIIIVVFDIASEGIIAHLRKEAEEAKIRKASEPSKPQTQVITKVEKHYIREQATPPQSQTPNITINMPQPGAQAQQPTTQYIDSRTVHVVAPNTPLQPAQNYPYFGANSLEGQRPATKRQISGQGHYPKSNNEPMASRNANPSSANS